MRASDLAAPGYFNPGYVESLAEFGEPLHLARSGASLLARTIGDTGLRDAMGGYPLFCCRDWSGLRAEIEALRERLVSVVVAPDPISAPDVAVLRATFEHVRPYKDHFVIRMGQAPDSFVNRRHREHARRALRQVEVGVCAEPLQFVDEFAQLFGVLASRHGIRGLRRFSRDAFARQFALPGLVMFRAAAGGRTLALDTWYVQGDCAQGHLSALAEEAYDLRVAYAVKWRVIEYFSDKVNWINLGAGRSARQEDGLSSFKRGWSNQTRPSWICGTVLQPSTYASLSISPSDPDYFPAYRAGQFD